MTGRLFSKLIVGVLLVLLVALTIVGYLVSEWARRSYLETLQHEVTSKARLLAVAQASQLPHLDHQTATALGQAAGARLTMIAADGHIIADSEAEAEAMENHAQRPEVQAALAGRTGADNRQSRTTGVDYFYVAIPLPAGALRLAVPLSSIQQQVSAIRRQVMTAIALAFLPALLVAALFARLVSRKLAAIMAYADRLAAGDVNAQLEDLGRDELGVLGRRLRETGQHLQRMFEENQREHAQLEKLEQIRRDFVSNVSHELRTPLASIQGYTETLLDGALYDPEHNMRFLSIIRQNAERLGRLTADLLTLSRVELKMQSFQFASHDINTLLRDCVESLAPLAAKKNIPIHLTLAPPLTQVFCDSESLHQIVSNLLDNALKYTSEGGSVTIQARPVTAENGESEVEMAVSDTGMGIPEASLPRLFERFYRVDKGRSRDLGGTGLGLAIVKHLVHANGGRVWVESMLGQGSTFRFTLQISNANRLAVQEIQPEGTQP